MELLNNFLRGSSSSTSSSENKTITFAAGVNSVGRASDPRAMQKQTTRSRRSMLAKWRDFVSELQLESTADADDEAHVKARSAYMNYPKRFPVPDERVPWSACLTATSRSSTSTRTCSRTRPEKATAGPTRPSRCASRLSGAARTSCLRATCSGSTTRMAGRSTCEAAPA